MVGEEMLPIEIAQALKRGATIVTGNQRASRTLRVAFDHRNRVQGLKSWQPAAIMAWDVWVAELWHKLLVEGHTSKLLLNRTQEHAVWRTILEADRDLQSLQTVDSLAEMAAKAWNLLYSYNGQRRLRGAAVSTDTHAFQRWALRFEQICKTDKLLSRAQLEEALQVAVSAGQLGLGSVAEVALVGFDFTTPSQLNLLDAFRGTGITIQPLRILGETKRRMLLETTDEHVELRIAARSLRRQIEEHPHARIAVIVPKLEEQRAEIDRVFREVLAPELQDITAMANSGPFEFSVGKMLTDTAMVATALDLLRWCATDLPLERVSRLLLSPYFAASEAEYGARAELDAFELRQIQMLRPEISLSWLITAIEGSKNSSKLKGFLKRLQIMLAVSKRLLGNDQRSYSDWADGIREILAAVWSVGKSEDSVEFQTRHKWESTLDEMATLDFQGTRVGFLQAHEALERIAQRTMFAPESREAPVQVMGPLEAAGSTFDSVLFLRSGDLNWPQQRTTNPLLPWPLQRDLHMPGTDAQRDAEYSRRITEHIAESTGTIVFSYAIESAEGRQRPSSALNELQLEQVGAEELVQEEAQPAIVKLEVLEDTGHLPLLPDQVIHGGSEILRLQAACGFRAFAERRLWSTELQSAGIGMNAAERGTIVHLVLERFWNEVKTQNALKAMTPPEREILLKQCISSALEKSEGLSSTPWDAEYLSMQKERLFNLLGPWLKIELSRPPFSVKLSEKALKDVRIGPLHLSVRVDRVDIGENGDIIIDYKTGIAKPSEWLSDRPDAPQLPLYAVLSETPRLEAVAFAQVRVGKEMGLQGFAVSDETGIRMPRQRPENLEQQVEDWRHVLTSLAEDFYHGDARVNPKVFPATCTYCAQRLLCRVDPSSFDEEISDEDATEAERD